MGMANLLKAQGFERENNWSQSLRYSDLAATKLKQMKDRPIEPLSIALQLKFSALNMMARHSEAMECAKEWYCLWLTKHTHPHAIAAAFCLIESCIHNKEFADAVLYAHTTWETVTLSRDSHIPEQQRQLFTAYAAYHLSKSILGLAQSGGMPAEEKQASGQEAITLARRSLELHTQMDGIENSDGALSMNLLADVLVCFNNVDDDEIFRLYEQAKAIFARAEGSSSPNVATAEKNLSIAYCHRASRADDANDLDRCVADLELALTHHREAIRGYWAANRVDEAKLAEREIVNVEEDLRRCVAARAARTRK